MFWFRRIPRRRCSVRLLLNHQLNRQVIQVGYVIEGLQPGIDIRSLRIRKLQDDQRGKIIRHNRADIRKREPQQVGKHTGPGAAVAEKSDGFPVWPGAEKATALMTVALIFQKSVEFRRNPAIVFRRVILFKIRINV